MAASTGYPTPKSILETRKHSEAGLMADPDNARLLGLLAYWLASDVLNGWNNAGKAEVDRAEAAARKAISLDPSVPRAHHALGWVYRIHGNHQAALKSFKEAIKVDPNFAAAYAQAANELVFLGDAKAAIPLTEKAIELSPRDMSKDVFTWVQGRAYFAIGDYEKAADALGEIGPSAAEPVVCPRLAGGCPCLVQSRCGREAGIRSVQESARCAIRPRFDHQVLQRNPIPKSCGASSCNSAAERPAQGGRELTCTTGVNHGTDSRRGTSKIDVSGSARAAVAARSGRTMVRRQVRRAVM